MYRLLRLGFVAVVGLGVVACFPSPEVIQTDLAATPAPGTGTFHATGSMAVARVWQTATRLADGRVLIAGGWDASRKPLGSAELYDPATGSFGPTGSMATAREEHTATLLADGRVLFAGGFAGTACLSSAELYDPKTGAFTPTGPMLTARASATATLLPDGQVLVVGGYDALIRDEFGVDEPQALSSAELYDPGTGVFRPTGQMATHRYEHGATLLRDGRVLIAGGDGGPGNLEPLASAEVYDPAKGAFGATGSMTVAHIGGGAILLPDGRIMVAGGSNGLGSLGIIDLYDPAAGAFTRSGPMPLRREGHIAALLADGRVLLAGGWAEAHFLASAVVFDPASGKTVPAEPMSVERNGATGTLLADGRVLVAGGESERDSPLASAEVYAP